jgi:hypothetical protein
MSDVLKEIISSLIPELRNVSFVVGNEGDCSDAVCTETILDGRSCSAMCCFEDRIEERTDCVFSCKEGEFSGLLPQ